MKLAEFFSNYFTVRAQLLKAVSRLSQEQLDWSSKDHPATIGKLLTHIANCEYFWIGCVAAGKTDDMDFTPFEKAQTLPEILTALEGTGETMTRFLQSEAVEDWDEVCYDYREAGGNAERFSKRWLVWHVVEHMARHRGQIFMLMRMQGLEVPNV